MDNAKDLDDKNASFGNPPASADSRGHREFRRSTCCYRPWFIWITGSVLVVAVLIGLLLPAVEKVRLPAARAKSSNNLKQIALAIYDFTSENKDTFPTAAIYDKNGNPLLSWRVAILPFVEQKELYNQFHLDEPWDSENNFPLLAKMPKVYQQPLKPVDFNTYYRVFHGVGTAFEGRKGLHYKDFEDGTSNTILVVEADEAVPWTKPEELEYDANVPLPKLGGHWPSGEFLAAMADGSVRSVRVSGNERNIRKAIVRNDGGILDAD